MSSCFFQSDFSSMNIRRATHDDIHECCRLLQYLFTIEAEFRPDRQLQRKGLEMIIRNPEETGIVLVAEEGNRLQGMVVLLSTISTALGKKVLILEDMIVDPEVRSRGIGSALISSAGEYAEKEGFGRITLLTDHDNAAAHAFYIKHGFRPSSMKVFRKKI